MPFYILILTNTYSNVKSDTLEIMLSNLIILSDLLHHLVHHFRNKLHYFMIYYITLPFFKQSYAEIILTRNDADNVSTTYAISKSAPLLHKYRTLPAHGVL